MEGETVVDEAFPKNLGNGDNRLVVGWKMANYRVVRGQQAVRRQFDHDRGFGPLTAESGH